MNDNHVLTSAQEIIAQGDIFKTRHWSTVTEQQLTAIIRGGTAVAVSQSIRGFVLSYGNVRREFLIQPQERKRWLDFNLHNVSLFRDIELDQPGVNVTWGIILDKANLINNLVSTRTGRLQVGLWQDGFSKGYSGGKAVDKFKLVGASPLSWLLANLQCDFTLVPSPPESAPMHAIPLIKEKPMNEKPGIPRTHTADGDAPKPEAQQAQPPKDEDTQEVKEGTSLLPHDTDMLTCYIEVAEDCFWVISKHQPKGSGVLVEPAKLVTTRTAEGKEVIVLRESDSVLMMPATQVEAALTSYSMQATHTNYTELVCGFCSWVTKHLTGGQAAGVRVYLEKPFPSADAAVHYESVSLISALTNNGEALKDLGMRRLASLTLSMRNLSYMSVGESAEAELTSLPILFHDVKKNEEGLHSSAKFRVAGKMFQCTGVDADGVHVVVNEI